MIKYIRILLLAFLMLSFVVGWGQNTSFVPSRLADSLNTDFRNYLRNKRNKKDEKQQFLDLFDQNAGNLSYFLQAGEGTCSPSEFWDLSNTTAKIKTIKSSPLSSRLCREESGNYLIMPATIDHKLFDKPTKDSQTIVFFKYSYSYSNGRVLCKIADIQKDRKLFNSCLDTDFDNWLQQIPNTDILHRHQDTLPDEPYQPYEPCPPVRPCPKTYEKEYAGCQDMVEQKDTEIEGLKRDTIWMMDSIVGLNRNLIELREYKDCMDAFSKERQKRKSKARTHIARANIAYNFFKANKLEDSADNEKLEKELVDTLRFCFKEYYSFAGYRGTYKCENGMEFTYDDNYLSAEENLFYAEMLGKYKNYGVNRGRNSRLSYSANLLDLLKGDDKVVEAGSIILWNIGQVMKNGTMEDKRKAAATIELLPITVRQDGAVVQDSAEQYPSLFKDVKEVYDSYTRGNYSAALDLYNRTEGYFFTTALKDTPTNSKAIARAKAAVGEILLYDYCDIQQSKELALNKSWLSKINDHKIVGRSLLSEALKSGYLEKNEEKKVSVALSKFFSVELKSNNK